MKTKIISKGRTNTAQFLPSHARTISLTGSVQIRGLLLTILDLIAVSGARRRLTLSLET